MYFLHFSIHTHCLIGLTLWYIYHSAAKVNHTTAVNEMVNITTKPE
jgi:hypothetical protein